MAFQGDSIFWVEVGKIVANPFQPRKEFNEDKLKELAESIRMYGILQPLTVTRNEIQEESGAFHTEYELIAGERRLRASRIAGLEQVPVIIRSGEDTEQEKLELAIIENLQREDLNAVDRALAFKQLADVFKLSHAQVAKKVGRSRMYVSNSIRLLGLPDCILNSVSLGDISEGHARTLLMLKERPEEQDVVYREILMKKLSVREVERIARKIATDKVRKKQWVGTDERLIEIEREFTDTLGTRVQIAKTDFGGKVTIDYFSDEDLQKLLVLMKSQKDAEKAPELVQEESSGTVIQEMSPEASTLAKVAFATPLEPVVDVVAPDVVTPAESADEVSMELNTDEVSSTVEIQDSVDEQVQVITEQSLDSEHPEQNIEQSSDPEEERIPVDLNSAEFAFVSQHTEEARKEDLVIPTELERTMFQDKPVLSKSLNEIQEDVTLVQERAQAAAEELTEAVAESDVSEDSQSSDKTEDDDLYSMKNFSL